MSAPLFYGIDPDEIYRWTPSAAKGEDGKANDGAPVFLLAPLTERLSLKIGALRQKQASLYAMARRAVFERMSKNPDATDEQREAAMSDEIEKLSDKADALYDEDIQARVLADCLKGWENLNSVKGAIKYTGEWSRDCRAIPATWRAEMFYAIVSESAFGEDAVLGFSLPQG